MRIKMEQKVADPVTYIPEHFIRQPTEQEIRGFNIPALWQQDGKVASLAFYISTKTGIFHMYFADERITYMQFWT